MSTPSPLPALPPGTAVVIPALGCQSSLDAILARIPTGTPVYVVDDGSLPPLVAGVPSGCGSATLLRHSRNRGYGAAQKTGYAAALADGAEQVIMVHGDGQYDLADTLALADALHGAEAAIGSRFLRPQAIPAWRAWGIHTLTRAANARFGERYTDLHNGARAFRAYTLRKVGFEGFPDGYEFDVEMIYAILREDLSLVERPVTMHYSPEVLSIAPRRAIRYGVHSLWALVNR